MSSTPDATGNTLNQPTIAERFPNRVRAQPLLPSLPNAPSMVPGKNRKRRIVKIAINDNDLPLELNHSLDGLTVPAQPSVGDNVTDGDAEESKLEQQKEKRQEENHKQNNPTIIANSNISSPTDDGVMSSTLSQLPLTTAGRPPPITTSIMKGSLKGTNSTPTTPTHHPEFPLLAKSNKGVSFPNEEKHPRQAEVSSLLVSKEHLSIESNSTALHATIAQKEVVPEVVCFMSCCRSSTTTPFISPIYIN